MNPKIFKLFVSSTFNDFQKERAILQNDVFPEIKNYCNEIGFDFQPIDLRWGVTTEAQLDQKAVELCLNEVKVCKTFPHPNFLIMMGDRYGWIPLPRLIEKKEFELLLLKMSSDERKSVNLIYQQDLNQIPTSYILKERRGILTDQIQWDIIESKNREIFQSAAIRSSLSERQRRKYFLSITDAEVEEGLFQYQNITSFQKKIIKQYPFKAENDNKYIFGFIRDIDFNSKCSNKFITDDFEEAQLFKAKVKSTLISDNVLHVQTRQLDSGSLDEHYLQQFKIETIEFLKSKFDEHRENNLKEEVSALGMELQAQKLYATQKRVNFIGQVDILKGINAYLNGNQNEPLIIHGRSGIGKSALMSKAIEMAEVSTNKKVLFRFVGATPKSSSSEEVLTSLLEEMGLNINNQMESFDFLPTGNRIKKSFEKFSNRVYDTLCSLKKEIIIFIDGVDQLTNDDQFLWLPSELPPNLKIVITALDDEDYLDGKYFKVLNKKSNYLLNLSTFENSLELIDLLLAQEQRKIQPDQRAYFFQQYSKVKTPFYVKVAAQELVHWSSEETSFGRTSKDGENYRTLPPTQTGIVREFITNLYKRYHHHQALISKIIGYISASAEGVSERELLELLAIDKKFIKQVASNKWHINHAVEFPIVLWTRLYAQLKPFLNLKMKDNEQLMFFGHREFVSVTKKLPSQQSQHLAMISATQDLILKYQKAKFRTNRWGKLYGILTAEYKLQYPTADQLNDHAEFISRIKNKDWINRYFDHLEIVINEDNIYNRNQKAIAYANHYKNAALALDQLSPEKWSGRYAIALDYLGYSYSNINNTRKGIDFGEESLKITRKLFNKFPSTWTKRHLRTILNLSASYRFENRIEEAISLGEENLGIARKNYELNNKNWVLDYSVCLINLSLSYASVGRTEEACRLQEENLDCVKKQYQSDPDYWKNEYTKALSHLSNTYREINKYKAAIRLLEEGVSLLKNLFKVDPDLYIGGYVSMSVNLTQAYFMNGNVDQSIALEKENLAILKRYYQSNELKWESEYATLLNNIGFRLVDSNQIKKGIEFFEQSFSIRKKLYETNPVRWTQQYTSIISNLGSAYKKMQAFEKAISLEEESLNILGELFKKQPDVWLEPFLKAQTNLALSHSELGRINNAILLVENCKELLEPYYLKNPNLWVDNYIVILNNLAALYFSVNRLTDTILIQEENVEIRKQLYKSNPDRWAQIYIKGINNLMPYYGEVRNFDKAINLGNQALDISSVLHHANPERWAKLHTNVLNNLAASYRGAKQLNKSIELDEENLRIRRKLFEENPEVLSGDYSLTLSNLAVSYTEKKRYEDAINLQKESGAILKKLYEKNRDNYEIIKSYCINLSNLSASYAALKNNEKAIEHINNALSTISLHYDDNPRYFTKDYLIFLNRLAKCLDKNGNVTEGMKMLEKGKNLVLPFFKEEPNTWINSYLTNLDTQLTLLKNNPKRSIEILNVKSKVLLPFYQKNPVEWFQKYTYCMITKSNFIKDPKLADQAIQLKKEAVSIREIYYEKDPEKFAKVYMLSLNDLSSFYGYQAKKERAIYYSKQALHVIEKRYGEDPEKWRKDYINAVEWLLLKYAYNEINNEIITLLEKVMELWSQFYKIDAIVHSKDFELSLKALARKYELNEQWQNALDQYERSFLITQKRIDAGQDELAKTDLVFDATKLLEFYATYYSKTKLLKVEQIGMVSKALHRQVIRLFIAEPEKWIGDYATALFYLGIFHSNKNEINKSIILLEMGITELRSYEKWNNKRITFLETVINLYEKSGDEAKAIFSRVELSKLKIKQAKTKKRPPNLN